SPAPTSGDIGAGGGGTPGRVPDRRPSVVSSFTSSLLIGISGCSAILRSGNDEPLSRKTAAGSTSIDRASLRAVNPLVLGEEPLLLEAIAQVARGRRPVRLGAAARSRIDRARRVVEAIAAGGTAAPAVYGVNPGFGALAEVRISPGQIAELQRNLVRSHAAGVGPPLATDAVRAMMLLRAAVLAVGCSGARIEVAELLCAMLERGVHPVIPSPRSGGAPGAPAPPAPLAPGL